MHTKIYNCNLLFHLNEGGAGGGGGVFPIGSDLHVRETLGRSWKSCFFFFCVSGRASATETQTCDPVSLTCHSESSQKAQFENPFEAEKREGGWKRAVPRRRKTDAAADVMRLQSIHPFFFFLPSPSHTAANCRSQLIPVEVKVLLCAEHCNLQMLRLHQEKALNPPALIKLV